MITRYLMVSIFSVILFSIVYFPIHKLFSYFSLPHAWLASLIAVMIFPVGLFLASLGTNKFTYYMVQFSNGWFGALLMVVSVTVIIEFIRWITKFQSPYTGWIILGVSVFLIIVSIISANLWTVKELVITSDKITEEVTFVQLSDLHAYGVLAPQKIKQVFDRTMKLNPDFIVVTGDFVDMPGKPPLNSYEVLNDIKVPIIYELGNHEAYVGLPHVRELVKRSNVALIEDSSLELNGITIVSISDSNDKKYVEKVLPTISRDADTFQVLLYHKPLEYKVAQENGIDLMLSGHTHAGQFFPVQLIVLMMYKYPWGTHDINGMTLHTSAGSGTFTWPLRLFSTNEIMKITLKPSI